MPTIKQVKNIIEPLTKKYDTEKGPFRKLFWDSIDIMSLKAIHNKYEGRNDTDDAKDIIRELKDVIKKTPPNKSLTKTIINTLDKELKKLLGEKVNVDQPQRFFYKKKHISKKPSEKSPKKETSPILGY